jgi:hypothetical protein
MAFIAGPYTVTYNSLALGILQDGIEFEFLPTGDEITGDNLGASVQDGVYRGGNLFLNFTIQEFNAAAAASAMWPWADALGKVGNIGALHTSFAKPVVLTRVSGTNAVYATMTFLYCAWAFDFPLRSLLASHLRNIPMRLRVFPYFNDSLNRWFTTT